MPTARVAHLFLSGFLAAGLAGCGSPTAVQDPPPIANLKGNWLIVGALPKIPSFPPPTGFSLAATLDVIDGSIYATQTNVSPCGNLGSGGAGALSVATLAADGSFTLQ